MDLHATPKALAKWMLAHTPYRVTRGAANRFDAVEACLRRLALGGFAPGLIVDAGARRGGFASMARRLFPLADIHMIEPQPACAAALRRLTMRRGFFFHQVAVGAVQGTLYMRTSGDEGVGDASGEGGAARIATQDAANMMVEATTLDQLFAGRVNSSGEAGERVLLRLDLDGQELCALGGASRFLPKVEVVQMEVSFMRHGVQPTLREIVDFLDEAGFELFDVAALFGSLSEDRLRLGDLLFVRRGTPLWRAKMRG